MNVFKSLSLFILLLSFQSSIYGQKVQSITIDLKQKLDSIASKDVPDGAPGIATGIVLNGEIIYQKCFGYANLEDSTLIDQDSRFNIASNGKQYTALAILKLMEEGQIHLDDNIQQFLPTLFTNLKHKITIRHLLDHTSGIRDVYDLWSLQGLTWWEHTFNNSDALSLLEKQIDVNFIPGSKHSYSNSNYIILAMIVEKVTDQSFIEYTNTMFRAVNMPNTSFVSDHKNIPGSIAKPYFNFDTWYGYDWIWNIYGDGNIFSSLKDQLEWEVYLQHNPGKGMSKELIGKSQSLIPKSSTKKYGYGLEFGEHQGISYTHHGGSTGAWKAITMRFPDLNLSIITLTNSGKTDPTGQSLAMVDALLGINPTVKSFPIEPDKIGEFVSKEDILGTYQTDFGYLMKFVLKEGEVYMQRYGRNDIKLLREADNIFHQWNDAPFKQEFTKNDKGEMQVTAYYPSVPPFTLTKINADFTSFNYKGLDGRYVNEETGVAFKVEHSANQTYSIIVGGNEMNGDLLTTTDLHVEDYRLKFEPNGSGNVEALLLNSGRIQNVKFKKEN